MKYHRDISNELCCDHSAIQYNKKIIGYDTTVGDIIAKSKNVDGKNWIKEICGRDREEQIISALMNAFNDMVEKDVRSKYQILLAYKKYPDFPKLGVLFEDLFSVMSEGPLLKNLVCLLKDQYKFDDIDYIVGQKLEDFV